MNKKSKTLFYIFISLFSIVLLEVFYLEFSSYMDANSLEKKKLFVKLSTLGDLAIANSSFYVRHRSLCDVFSIYKDDGILREYAFSTYVISDSHNGNKNER